MQHPLRLVCTAVLLWACSCGGSEVDSATTTDSETTTAVTTVTTTTQGPTTSSTTDPGPDGIEGMWLARGENWGLVFEDDGSWRAFYQNDPGSSFDFGTYEFDGDLLTLHSSPEVAGSPCAGNTGTYRVVDDDRLDAMRFPASGAEDECQRRRDDLVSLEFIGVRR
jgi:hypothetical protein